MNPRAHKKPKVRPLPCRMRIGLHNVGTLAGKLPAIIRLCVLHGVDTLLMQEQGLP